MRMHGQCLDRETGLHYNTFRYYDADLGAFTTPDPIGLSGGLSLHQYAPNPVRWIDPWGWSPCDKEIAALRNGGNGTAVNVKTKKEADELLTAAFPGAQKVRGIGSQDAQGICKQRKKEQFKKNDGQARYRKDYAMESKTGRV